MPATASPLRVVLHEGAGSRPLASERRAAILRTLLERGYAVTCTTGDGQVSPADESDLLVLRESGTDESSAHQDSVQGAAGGDTVRVRFRDIAGVDVDGVVTLVDGVRDETAAYKSGEWKPWFPVIDYERCTNCMQCLSFCLFDVYGVDAESEIQVKNPDKCKTNCPACSRVCPDVAILFPKYGAGPINGDDVKSEDLEREKMKIDVSALLGGDIYSMLKDRHKRAESRFSKERDEGKALKERIRCLKKLQGEFDIPEEVLQSLPSLDQIQAKAQAAADAVPKNREEGGARAK